MTALSSSPARPAVRYELVDRDATAPAHLQVLERLRALALAMPWDEAPLLPAEPVLMQRFGVSRGTLRRATAELVRDGLLVAERGRGTFVARDHQVRLIMADRLREIAEADSRWHTDVTRFVPDFAGSELAAERLRQLPTYASAATVFIAPDNSLRGLIEHALADGKTIVVPTFGLRRGFVRLDAHAVAAADRAFAATLDGLERFGHTLELDELEGLRIELMVTGAQAVSADGRHFGTAEGYFELEWALLAQVGAVGEDTYVACLVHDIQVLPIRHEWEALSVYADAIVTQSQTIEPGSEHPRPRGLAWMELPPSRTHGLAYLDELRTPTDQAESSA